MQILWRYPGPRGVLRIIKNCCVESQLLSGQMHRECYYYCEVSMNNIKALPGCFRGSRQLGQTLVGILLHYDLIYLYIPFISWKCSPTCNIMYSMNK